MKNVNKAKIIKLSIDSDIDNVSLVGLSVKALCSYIPLNEVASYQIELAVVEAVTNAIEHAYASEKGNRVEIIVSIHIDKITFNICDQGKAMESLEIESIDFDPNNLETVPEKGMGLHIVQQVMDEVSYDSSDGKNVLTMCKYFLRKS